MEVLHLWHIFWFLINFLLFFCIHSYFSSKPLGQQTLLDEINKDFTASICIMISFSVVENIQLTQFTTKEERYKIA